jgi:hypothetical protein
LLRSSGEDATIGAGVVADTIALAPHRDAARALASWQPDPAQVVAFEAQTRSHVMPEELASRTVYSAAELTQALRAANYRELAPGIFVDKVSWDDRANAVKAAVAAAYAKKSEPVGVAALKNIWAGKRVPANVLDTLVAAGELKKQGEGFLPAGGAPKTVAETPAVKAARAYLAAGKGEPVTFRDAATDVKKGARELARAGEWVELGDEFFWERVPFDAIRAKVEGHLREKHQASTSDLKTLCGLSRKVAVLVFEQLDRDRLTYLKDGVRRLLKG